MNVDIKENIAKIIEAKMKQIKTQAEFYENKIRTEVRRVIEIEDKIRKLKVKIEEKSIIDGADSEHTEDIVENEIKLVEIKQIIRELRTEKKNVLECDVNLQFNDDLSL